MHLLKALSEKAASFYGGGVICCWELSDSGKNVSIHWLVVFKLLKFQGEEMIVLHSDWEALLWFGIDKKWIKFITVPCIEDGIQCSRRKQARKLFLRRMRTAELLWSYPRRGWGWCFKFTRDYVTVSTDKDGKEGAAAPLLAHCKRLVAILQNCMLTLSWKEKHINGFQKPSHPGFLSWVTHTHQKNLRKII